MGETGWRATTLNYQWPVAFSLLTFYPFFQLLRGEEINRKIYWVRVKSRLLCKMLYNVFTISTYQN
ncbi:hypothetical protein BSQ85_15725 [Enterococcus faecium]|nr:hypothetical protein BSQ85_15725 [Enterococcus faecium]